MMELPGDGLGTLEEEEEEELGAHTSIHNTHSNNSSYHHNYQHSGSTDSDVLNNNDVHMEKGK